MTMRRFLESSWFWALMVLALVSGAALLAASAWLRPLAEGEKALQDGRLEQALESFAAAEARFDRLPVAKRLLAAEHATSQVNQSWLLYKLGRHDVLIEKTSMSPSLAPVHFWAGCALFAKARDEEEEAEARLAWLGRSGDEFRKALELQPEDWDTKFNYELSQRLLAALRKQPKAPPTQLLQLLRPKPKEGQPPARRAG
jgi:hypothetical protein